MLEGVAFVERLGYERLTTLGLIVEPPIAATGEGSTSTVWSRIRATVLGMPLLRLSGASTALGACILAAAGTVHPDLPAATAAMSPRGDVVQPVEEEREQLEVSYRRFVEALAGRGWLASASTP
jgi:sugar (pentulose or hexulose) kinase